MNIELMKAKVLDLAIRGRLTEQSPDEALRPEVLQLPEVKGPFELPDSWRWVNFGDIAKINPRNKLDDDLEVSFVAMADIEPGYVDKFKDTVKPWGEVKKGFTHFQDGDLLVAKITPCFQNRKSCIALNLMNGYGAGTTEVHTVRAEAQCASAQYLLCFCKSEYFIKLGVSLFSGSVGQQRVSKNDLAKIKVPLPPLAEQRRIVQKAEELFKIIDALQEHQDSLLDKLDLIRRTALDKAIRGQLTEQHADESLSPEVLKLPDVKGLFELPDNWRWVSLSNAGVWKSGGTPSRKEPSFYKNGTIHWFKTGELCDGYLTNSEEKITKSAVEKLNLRINPAGAVLIAMYGATIGRLGILSVEATTNQACCACITGPAVLNKYLFYYLLAQRSNLIKLGRGGAQNNISKTVITNYTLPLPPLAEQRRIAAKLESIFSAVCTVEQLLQEQQLD